MKTYKNLFEDICSLRNLFSAYRKARKGKRYRDYAIDFDYNLESNILRLQRELLDGTYRPGGYKKFYIYEPKKRTISAAPFRDRVVHHALCNIIEPIFDRTFIYDSYACRVGKGTHRAILRFVEFARKNEYVLKCDVQKYFPNIDHQILLDIIGRKIKDERAMNLVSLIVGSSKSDEREFPPQYFPGDTLFDALRPRGIPIGNLTSQFFANIYLNELDYFVKFDLRCRYYIRYVDDLVVLSDSKRELHDVRDEINRFLEKLRLRLHPSKQAVFPVSVGTDFLGFRVFRDHRLLRNENGWRFVRRLRRLERLYYEGHITRRDVEQSIRSWIAHASFGDTYGLRRHLLKDFVLS